jgi:hypothetical protein
MSFVLHTGVFQNPDHPEFGQKPARILKSRILNFRNPPLKSMSCAKTQNPDWLRAKNSSGF